MNDREKLSLFVERVKELKNTRIVKNGIGNQLKINGTNIDDKFEG